MRHPVDFAPSQDFGDNPTSILPASHWIIKQFGNYQPDGHTGTDYPCPLGTPVRAAADGKVLHVGFMAGTYADNPWWISPGFAGYVAVIDHGSFIGIYGHCLDGSAGVSAGDTVTEGQVFIRSGNTGASTGPHLHFECLPDGYVLNSYMYGRINPATLFGGSLSYAGTTTTITPLEDELSAAEVTQILEGVQAIVRNEVAKVDELAAAHHAVDRTHIPNAVLSLPVPYKDPITGQDTGQTTTLGTMVGFADFQAVQTRLAASTPQQIANLVPEEFVDQVSKLLIERLSK